MDSAGVFIALEGSDGSGKTTQFNLLRERLEATGYEVETFKFPQYESDSSHFVRRYLNGEYGSAKNINPYTASLFYALDRYEGASRIRQALEAGKVVLSDRYAGANMAHQGAKFGSSAEKRGFFVWADSLEFQLLGMPRPDINVFLRVPAEVSFKIIEARAARDYTDKVKDEHEADIDHLKAAVETYDMLCELFPKDFHAIECVDNNKLLAIPQINNMIWDKIQPLLKNVTKHKGKSKIVSLNDKQQDIHSKEERKNRYEKLSISSQNKLIKIRLEQISLLAARYLSSLSSAKPKQTPKKEGFYLPTTKDKKATEAYKKFISETSARQKLMSKVLKNTSIATSEQKKIIESLSPLGMYCDLELEVTADDLKRMIAANNTSQLKELNSIASKLNSAARNKWPKDFDNLAKRNRSASNGFSLPDDLSGQLSSMFTGDDPLVKVIQPQPRNEFDLIAEEFYASSAISRNEVSETVAAMPYEQKSEILENSLAETTNDSVSVRGVKYELEVLVSGQGLDYLISNGIIEFPSIQTATPQFGYQVPEWAADAGIEDILIDGFDESLRAYSQLQSSAGLQEAQYAVLLGHRLRLEVEISLSCLARLARKAHSSECPSEIKLLNQSTITAISEHHPIIATWLDNIDSPLKTKSRRRNRRHKHSAR
jgi:dTMP kinase